jgi:hypothetical protein
MKLTTGIRGTSFRSHLPMSDDQLREYAPSVFATEPYVDRSDKYAFTSTIDKINVLRDEGFFPFFVAQSRARIEDKRGHTKHMVRLRRDTRIEAAEADEIILVNDSAGQSSDICFMGVVRFACANGMISASGVSEYRVPHRGNAADNVIEGVYTVLDSAEIMHESMDAMKSITLSNAEQRVFANSALQLRWDEGSIPVTAENVLERRRREDTGNDLWTVTNVIQEALVRGGNQGRTRTNRRMTTRPVASVNENVRLNRAIWQLAEEMRQLKA